MSEQFIRFDVFQQNDLTTVIAIWNLEGVKQHAQVATFPTDILMNVADVMINMAVNGYPTGQVTAEERT
jgi:hypothetical protein